MKEYRVRFQYENRPELLVHPSIFGNHEEAVQIVELLLEPPSFVVAAWIDCREVTEWEEVK